MTENFNESTVEDAALSWFERLGYEKLHGPEIAPGEPHAERESYDEVVLRGRFHESIFRINPTAPQEALEEAINKVEKFSAPEPVSANRQIHEWIAHGVEVEYRSETGEIRGELVRLIDYDDPKNNDWLVVNQFTVTEGHYKRRPDIVVFINGLPTAIIELKNLADEEATIWSAFKQLQTYKHELNSLFSFNELLIISDGMEARVGSLTADKEWFMPWKTIEGEELAPSQLTQLQVMIEGVFEKSRLLSLIRHFVVFEEDGSKLIKKIAGYHQFHAVHQAVESTLAASSSEGDRRGGVVWHTQGSGKSLTMLFFSGKIIMEPAMENPTIVVITDRNDLDDQLFGTFSRSRQLLRQTPVQAKDRTDLRKLLNVASGGIVFTTIQKFLPEEKGDTFPQLSDRRNIIVVTDEAHRSQYDFIDGFARHIRDALPEASFLGFTGTPIELTDKNTRAVFGDYVSIYDIQQAVEDGATVPIYYESRLVKVDLKNELKNLLDQEFEEVTEGEEVTKKEKLKTKWAALEAVVGTQDRLSTVAQDLVNHFEQRLEALEGKAMVVCMSRRICVDLYAEIIKLRPDWNSGDDNNGALKIVMTGSATDPVEWQQHIRNKSRREFLANRFKNSNDPLKMVIVRDMWLTGFDVPCLHTMYVDKPMRGHGLMQGIARVNRVFKDKPGGLIVDYIGVADQLRKALANYTNSGGKGNTAIDQEEALRALLEKFENCRDMFHGFDYSIFFTGDPTERLSVIPAAQEHILQQEDGKNRFKKMVEDLSKAFALAVPHEKALEIRDHVKFFQTVKASLMKLSPGAKTPEELDLAIRQIVSKAVASDEVVDIFSSVGLPKPDVSILSDDFLAEVKGLPQKNLAVELLRKLLKDEIKTKSRSNVVQSRSFAEMLEKTIRSYQNRSIETAQAIEELIQLAKELKKAHERGEELGLSEEELAFYDTLETNDSAVKVLGDDVLRNIARELVDAVRKNTSIDWSIKSSSRAKLRVAVKRVLRKHGYPPDKEKKATETVLEQAELISEEELSVAKVL
jgi:type I restriction enzyme, R subunit